MNKAQIAFASATLMFLLPSAASSQGEVARSPNWKPVPGTALPSLMEPNPQPWRIGTNTIERNGNVINFEVNADGEYVRYSANCRTRMMTRTLTGYLNVSDQISGIKPVQEGFFLASDSPQRTQVLEYACSQMIAQKPKLVEVGRDAYDDAVVYVNLTSIRKVGQAHQYTIVSDPSRKNGRETDAIVDCGRPKEIRLLEARYYSNGELRKTEPINYTQEAIDAGSPYLTANRVACQEIARINSPSQSSPNKPDLTATITKWENIIPGFVGWPANLPQSSGAKTVQREVDNGWAVNLTAVVTVKIKNQGNIDAPASNLSIKLQQLQPVPLGYKTLAELNSVSINSLQPGQEVTIPVKLQFNQDWNFFGDAVILAEVDSSNLIPEASETNNSSTREIILADPRPDYRVDRIFQNEEDARTYLKGLGFFEDKFFGIQVWEGWSKYLQGNKIRSRRDGDDKPAKAYRQDAYTYNLAKVGGNGVAVIIQGTDSFGEPNPNYPEYWTPNLEYVYWWHQIANY